MAGMKAQGREQCVSTCQIEPWFSQMSREDEMVSCSHLLPRTVLRLGSRFEAS